MTRLIRYQPLRISPYRSSYYSPRSRLHEQMNDLFERSFSDHTADERQATAGIGDFNPSVDIEQDDACYEVTVELAGVKRDDVNVEVSDDQLIISGSKEERRGGTEPREGRAEGDDEATGNRQSQRQKVQAFRRYGSFQQSISLPQDADTDNIEASFADGVLTVTIPRDDARDNRVRRIDIQCLDSDAVAEQDRERITVDQEQFTDPTEGEAAERPDKAAAPRAESVQAAADGNDRSRQSAGGSDE